MWNNLAELFMNFIKTPISNDYLTFMLKKKVKILIWVWIFIIFELSKNMLSSKSYSS